MLDHVGGAIGLGRYAGKRDEVFAEWNGRIKELARCPNVHVKLGGLGMRLFGFDVHEQADAAELGDSWPRLWRPYIETCIAAFGPERAMFESNFPVDKGSGSYPGVLERVQAHRRGLLGRGEGGAVLRHREQILPPRDLTVAQSAPNPNYHVRPDWLARRTEDVLEPGLPIVDPHHHLVGPRRYRPLSASRAARRSRQRPQHHRDRLPANATRCTAPTGRQR